MSRHSHHQTILVIATIGYLLALVFALPSYAGKAQIVGEVVDGAGKPLPDAVVSVEFTTFKANTNAQGKYSVGYVPGKVKVLIQKAGYTSATIPLDIAIETTFPAAPVTLHKIPQPTCEVCMDFQGRTQCRSASARDDMLAIQSARDDACKSLVTDKTALSLCGQTPPARVTCKEQ